MEISPETVAQEAEECYILTANRIRAAPRKGRRVVFLGGVCTCRAGPMCPAAGYAFSGGARGPRPTGRYVEPRVGDGVLQWSVAEQMPLGYDVPSARQRRAVIARSTPRVLASRRVATRQSVFLFWGRQIPTPVFVPARNDRERADRVVRPYKLGMTGSTAALRAMHAASALSYTGAGEGYTVRRCGGGSWFLGICALGLGLGILIAAVFPVGCLMFLVAFLLIACGVVCLRDRR